MGLANDKSRAARAAGGGRGGQPHRDRLSDLPYRETGHRLASPLLVHLPNGSRWVKGPVGGGRRRVELGGTKGIRCLLSVSGVGCTDPR